MFGIVRIAVDHIDRARDAEFIVVDDPFGTKAQRHKIGKVGLETLVQKPLFIVVVVWKTIVVVLDVGMHFGTIELRLEIGAFPVLRDLLAAHATILVLEKRSIESGMLVKRVVKEIRINVGGHRDVPATIAIYVVLVRALVKVHTIVTWMPIDMLEDSQVCSTIQSRMNRNHINACFYAWLCDCIITKWRFCIANVTIFTSKMTQLLGKAPSCFYSTGSLGLPCSCKNFISKLHSYLTNLEQWQNGFVSLALAFLFGAGSVSISLVNFGSTIVQQQ